MNRWEELKKKKQKSKTNGIMVSKIFPEDIRLTEEWKMSAIIDYVCGLPLIMESLWEGTSLYISWKEQLVWTPAQGGRAKESILSMGKRND